MNADTATLERELCPECEHPFMDHELYVEGNKNLQVCAHEDCFCIQPWSL